MGHVSDGIVEEIVRNDGRLQPGLVGVEVRINRDLPQQVSLLEKQGGLLAQDLRDSRGAEAMSRSDVESARGELKGARGELKSHRTKVTEHVTASARQPPQIRPDKPVEPWTRVPDDELTEVLELGGDPDLDDDDEDGVDIEALRSEHAAELHRFAVDLSRTREELAAKAEEHVLSRQEHLDDFNVWRSTLDGFRKLGNT